MSSGTPSDPNAARAAVMNAGGNGELPPHIQLSARQRILSAKWAFFRAERYDGWKVAWDGSSASTIEQRDQIAHEAVLPDGFVDSGGSTIPVEYRKPDAPYNLVRQTVLRFSGMLFGEKRHPKFVCPEDEDTEDFANALAKAGSLWAQMWHARNHGGGMGSVALGFVITDGRPAFEVHDGRWCTPTFANRFDHTLKALEKRFPYPVEERSTETGEWEVVWYWYRRVLTEKDDAVWDRVPVGDGTEPAWDLLPVQRVEHGMGEVQAVWIQNIRNDESVDGDTDCHGEYETSETIDRLTSTGARGARKNADPNVVIKSDLEFDSIAKGSENAIQVEPVGDANYMELSGTGVDTAFRVASILEARFCRSVRVMLENSARSEVSGGEAKTATETVSDSSAMHEQVGVLREQYGERGVRKLMGIALRTCRRYLQVTLDVTKQRVVQRVLRLPPREMPPLIPGGKPVLVPRKPGASDNIDLSWPSLVTPSAQEVLVRVQAATAAKDGGLVDVKHAAEYVASDFGVEDVDGMLEDMKKAQEEQQAAQDEALFNQTINSLGKKQDGGEGKQPAPPGSNEQGPPKPAGAPPAPNA